MLIVYRGMAPVVNREPRSGSEQPQEQHEDQQQDEAKPPGSEWDGEKKDEQPEQPCARSAPGGLETAAIRVLLLLFGVRRLGIPGVF